MPCPKIILNNVGTGISNLMSISEGLDPSVFCRKIRSMRPVYVDERGEICLFPACVGLFLWFSIMKVIFPVCTLTRRVDGYVSRQRIGIDRRSKITTKHNNCFDAIEQYPYFRKFDFSFFCQLLLKNNNYFGLKTLLNIFPSPNVATQRHKRKLAVINWDHHEDYSRNDQARNPSSVG